MLNKFSVVRYFHHRFFVEKYLFNISFKLQLCHFDKVSVKNSDKITHLKKMKELYLNILYLKVFFL